MFELSPILQRSHGLPHRREQMKPPGVINGNQAGAMFKSPISTYSVLSGSDVAYSIWQCRVEQWNVTSDINC